VLAVAGSLVATPSLCAEASPRLALHVTRADGASDCPDVATLAASLARVVGRDVPSETAGAPADLRVDVAFTRRESRYVATVKAADAHSTGERTMVHQSATCAALAEAVVATIALRLDDGSDDASGDGGPDEAPAQPAAPPSPPLPTSRPVPIDRARDPAQGSLVLAGDPGGRQRWYGWQILGGDALAGGLVVLGFALSPPSLDGFAYAGLGWFAATGPIAHAAHDRWGALAASAAMRIALPLLGALIGRAAAPSCSPAVGGLGPTAIVFCDAPTVDEERGALVGMFLASSIDVVALSWERVGPTRHDVAAGPRITPMALVLPEPGGGAGGLVGIAGSL
jgi:hypothetical protein